MPTHVTPRDFAEIRWIGHWIWVPEEPLQPGNPFGGMVDMNQPEAHGLFRKTFHLAHVPGRVPARMTADSRYALFVNGQEASRGPIRSQPRRLHYDFIDLAPFLRVGDNIIAAYVKYYGTPKSYWMPATPNMTLGKSGVFVFEADLGDHWLLSDESWRARRSDAWFTSAFGKDSFVVSGVPLEMFDARRYPAGWQALAFDDAAWGKAHRIPAMHIGGYARTQPPTDPYGPMYPRPIAPLTGELRTPVSIQLEYVQGGDGHAPGGDPVTQVEHTHDLPIVHTSAGVLPLSIACDTATTPRVVIDMGRIVSGRVVFGLEAPAGTTLDFCYREEPGIAPAGLLGQHSGTRYVARGAQDDFEVFDSNGFRYATLIVTNVQAPATVTLHKFGVRESLYPWQAGATFESSDAELNKIFTAGIRTVQLNSNDAFIDCPTREQRAWVGDSVVHQMVHLATNTDWRLAWHALSVGNSPRPDGILPMSVVGEIEANGGITIPDWSLHWVHGVFNLYRFGGDRETVKSFLPTVERILRWYLPYQTADGVLKDVTEWNLIDWASISNEDTSAVITASWARGLHEFSQMAAWLDERGSRRWADALHARVKAGFEVFWNEKRGTYIDHIKEGQPQPEISQLAGALAICADVAPRRRWRRIAETITDPSVLVGAAWGRPMDDSKELPPPEALMGGVYHVNWDTGRQIVLAQPFMNYVVHDAVALAGLGDKLPDLYRRWTRFFADGYDTIGECWSWGTHVHGWSCTPTRDMVFYTLGVTPAEPGYARARIAPRLGSLAWVKGQVPTPHGLIEVHATPDSVTINSPVPVILDFAGQKPRSLLAGRHTVARERG